MGVLILRISPLGLKIKKQIPILNCDDFENDDIGVEYLQRYRRPTIAVVTIVKRVNYRWAQGRGPGETGRTVRQVHHVVGRLDAPADVQLQRFGAVRVRGVRLLVAAAAGRRPVAA